MTKFLGHPSCRPERPRRGDILLSESVRPSLGDRVQGSMKRVRNFVQRAERHFSVGTN